MTVTSKQDKLISKYNRVTHKYDTVTSKHDRVTDGKLRCSVNKTSLRKFEIITTPVEVFS